MFAQVVLSLIIKCGWCGKVLGGDGTPPVTHGFCGSAECERKANS